MLRTKNPEICQYFTDFSFMFRLFYDTSREPVLRHLVNTLLPHNAITFKFR